MKALKRRFLVLLFFLAALGVGGATKLAANRAPAPTAVRPLVVTAILPAPTALPTFTLAPTATPPIVRTVKPEVKAEPVATVKVDPVVQVVVTAQPGLNVRTKPGGAIVGSVRTGTVLSVKNAGDWAIVIEPEWYKGRVVKAQYLLVK